VKKNISRENIRQCFIFSLFVFVHVPPIFSGLLTYAENQQLTLLSHPVHDCARDVIIAGNDGKLVELIVNLLIDNDAHFAMLNEVHTLGLVTLHKPCTCLST